MQLKFIRQQDLVLLTSFILVSLTIPVFIISFASTLILMIDRDGLHYLYLLFCLTLLVALIRALILGSGISSSSILFTVCSYTLTYQPQLPHLYQFCCKLDFSNSTTRH
jgi:hypothetical protein